MKGPVEAALARDRAVLGAGMAVLVLIAGAYTVFGVGMEMSAVEMTAMADGDIGMATMAMAPAVWAPTYALLVFLMWWVMMIAMMTPSAAPVILLHAALRHGQGAAALSGIFLAGYLAVWAAFSLAATMLQWGLETAGLMRVATMAVSAPALGGAILIAAGLYQFTALKHACLAHCREPARFLAARRRNGQAGALLMGVEHGAFCLGCCWFLMALLFVGGIMNLYWIAGLALYVLAEKLLPAGRWLSQVAGAALLLWGAALVARAAGLV